MRTVTIGVATVLVAGLAINPVEADAQSAKGINNREQAVTATASGGENNTARGAHSTIAGGLGNNTLGDRAAITGGRDNIVAVIGTSGAIGGGSFNEVRGAHGTVSGGTNGHAQGEGSTVSGGRGNRAIGDYAAIGGGAQHTASGRWSTVPGGIGNVAAGDFSFAAGRSARVPVTHPGAMVFADGSTGRAFSSSVPNELAVRASGGVRLHTRSDLATGVRLAAGSGSWDLAVSGASLENRSPVDAEELLFALAYLPVTSWNWDGQDPSVRHLGPSAEDFAAAFGVGDDTGLISTIDAAGVAFVAVQALYERLIAAEARIEVLEALLDAPGG
jgi:hypothetical protein